MRSQTEWEDIVDDTQAALYAAIKSVAEEAEALKGAPRASMLLAAANAYRLVRGGPQAGSASITQ